jgi:hypothetical protein
LGRLLFLFRASGACTMLLTLALVALFTFRHWKMFSFLWFAPLLWHGSRMKLHAVIQRDNTLLDAGECMFAHVMLWCPDPARRIPSRVAE